MNRLGSTSCSTRTKVNGDGAIRLRKLARGPHRWSCSRLRSDESTGRSKPRVRAHTINLLSESNYKAKWKSGNFAVVVHNQRARLSHSMLIKLDAACGNAWCVTAPELWGGRCYGVESGSARCDFASGGVTAGGLSGAARSGP